MTAPVFRPSPQHTLADLQRRIRALEAVPAGSSAFSAVWGALYNDATIIEGTGFTAVWDGLVAGVSQITITFDTPFMNPPVVLLTPNNNNPTSSGPGRYTATLLSRTNAEIVYITTDIDDPGSLATQDGGFDFLAIEPGV